MPLSLYHRWLEIVAQNRDSIAVTDAASGKRFSFSELDGATVPATQFPQGKGIEFLQQTIAAWRAGLPTCPLEIGANTRPPIEGLPEGIAHIKTTSGTTGEPRLILFTADQLAADAANIVATMGLQRSLPNVGVISMAHSYGYSNLVLPLLLHGIPLVVGSDPLPGAFQHALTFLPPEGGSVPAVPAMWRAWLKAGYLDPGKIEIAISAGAPLTIELERAIFEETAIKVHNFYGSSECGGIAYDRSDSPRKNAETVGTAMNGVTTSLNSQDCLTVGGAAVGSTYWPIPDADSLAGQQFHTQDLAEIRPDGTIYLRGRAGDLINIAGRKLDPTSIENKLLDHASVEHCVVFGIPSSDPERVQEIVAIVSGGDQDELSSHLAKTQPAWQKVRHWWINPEIRPTERGKISRAHWRERWTDSL